MLSRQTGLEDRKEECISYMVPPAELGQAERLKGDGVCADSPPHPHSSGCATGELTLLCSMSWKSTSFTESTWSPSCNPALCASESGITCRGDSRDGRGDTPPAATAAQPPASPVRPPSLGLGRGQEMAQRRLIAAWCTANYSSAFRDGTCDSVPAHPAGSATPKGTATARGGTGRRTDTP